jgi:signal transduction histidine kinase
LLGNALKFTDTGSITIASKAHREKNLIEIRVTDTGKGIPAEIQPILFEKFATKGHGDASQNKGTGLGLYICKAIVTAHRGTISAFNNPNGGATFQILLPISQIPNVARKT